MYASKSSLAPSELHFFSSTAIAMAVAQSLLLLALSIAGLSRVQRPIQDDWPSPPKGSIWYTGQTYLIRWDADLQDGFQQNCPSCDTSNVDLWITPSSSATDSFYRLACQSDVLTPVFTISDLMEQHDESRCKRTDDDLIRMDHSRLFYCRLMGLPLYPRRHSMGEWRRGGIKPYLQHRTQCYS